MKNMKRLLALVLVLVMTMALVPGFASAGPAAMNVDDYADFSDIPNNRREAVDVLTALGILTGYEISSGYEFRGDRNVTRAEAAKIISYILLGKEPADRLVQTATRFRDVPASHWASGFVAYCSTRGIIDGYPDGNFLPENNVTGAQIAKMLLIALGFGRNGEYVGDNWQINAIVDGQRMDRTSDGVTGTFMMNVLSGNADFSAPATRLEIAQYTFNTLRKNMVEYSQFLGYLTGYEDGMLMIGPQVNLGRNTFNLRFQNTTDDFGFGWRYWHLNNINRPITDEYTRDTVAASFVANADHTKHYMSVNFNYRDDWDYSGGGLLYYINGAEGRIATESSLVQRGNNTIVFPPGAFVTIMRDGNDIVNKIIVEYELLGRVTSVNTNAGSLTAQVYEAGKNGLTGYGATVYAEGFVRNDWILISPNDNNNGTFPATGLRIDPDLGGSNAPPALRATKADTLTGRATSTTGNFNDLLPDTGRHTITVDGTRYPLAAAIGYGFGSGSPGFDDANTFYLDSFGSIIGYEAAAASTGEAGLQYAFVVDIGSQTGLGVGNRRSIAMYTTDGKYHELPLAQYRVTGSTARPAVLQYNGDNRYPTSGNDALVTISASGDEVAGTNNGLTGTLYAAHVGMWWSYIITDDNEVVLKAVPSNVVATVYRDFNWENSRVNFNYDTAGPTYPFGTQYNALNANSNLTLVQDESVRRFEGASKWPRNDKFEYSPMNADGAFATALVILAQTQDDIDDAKDTSTYPNGYTTQSAIAQVYVIDSKEGFGDADYGIMLTLVADYGSYELWEVLTNDGLVELKIYKSSGSLNIAASKSEVVKLALRTGTTDIYDVQRYWGDRTYPASTTSVTQSTISGSFQSADTNAIVINASTVYTVTADTLFLRWTDWAADEFTIDTMPQKGAGTVADDDILVILADVGGGADNTAVAVISLAP